MNINGLTEDSRLVRPGMLFAALSGNRTDGIKFIQNALGNGATTLLVPQDATIPENCSAEIIKSDNVRLDFALLCAKFYARQPQTLIGVTGTSGKTSTTNMVRQIWQKLGKTTGVLGTLGALTDAWQIHDDSMTTPPAEKLFALLQRMADSHVTHAAMEISSHALEQHRVDGVRLAAAAFTNLSRDHLDYHADMDAYFAAKAKLFTDLLPHNAPAIINTDTVYGQRLKDQIAKQVQTLDVGANAQFLRITSIAAAGAGQDISVVFQGREHSFTLPLAGTFQALNACLSAAIVLAVEPALGFDDIRPALESMQGIEGRLQPVSGHPKGALVFVDYAHKPEGLEQVLDTLRPATKGRLVCVFGCGGNRDKGKRPIMGKIAADKADIVIITDDNPRHEDAATIRAEIAVGAPAATVTAGRAEAIAHAVALLNAGDTLVIAGKGHETYQIIGDEVLPFSDLEVAKTAMERLSNQ